MRQKGEDPDANGRYKVEACDHACITGSAAGVVARSSADGVP